MEENNKSAVIFIIVFSIILIGGGVVAGILELGFWPSFIGVAILEFIAIWIYSSVKSTACPKCGKTLSMREISRKVVSSYATTKDIQREVKNNKGEVIRTYYEAVPATCYVHDCIDECKFCGYQQKVQRSETYRD